MGKCLVTKLEGSVLNNNLPLLGVLTVKFSVDSINQQIGQFSKTTFKCNKRIIYQSQSGIDLEEHTLEANTELSLQGTWFTIKSLETGEHVFYIKKHVSESFYFEKPSTFVGLSYLTMLKSFSANALDAYDIAFLQKSKNLNDLHLSGNFFGDLSAIDGLPINVVEFKSKNIKGNLSNISNNVLKRLTVLIPNIQGNISVLKNCVNLISLDLSNSSISGKLEELAELQVSAGRNSGNITGYTSAYTSYNNSNTKSGHSFTIKFGSSYSKGYEITY